MEKQAMKKIALMGDSIFDNRMYVKRGYSVIEQFNQMPDTDWKAELLAVDGNVTKNVVTQCQKISAETTHLIISVGGNDALSCLNIFEKPASSVNEVMELLTVIKDQFQSDYKEMIDALIKTNKKLAVCTVYDTIPGIEKRVLTALALFNEVILKEAFRHKIPVIDLRLIFNNNEDYSSLSPIEPSEIGGEKLVAVILQCLEQHDFSDSKSLIYIN